MGKVTTVGIDLAKNVFSVHGIDETGVVLFRKSVSRARLMPLVAAPCSAPSKWLPVAGAAPGPRSPERHASEG